jgi:hypothetical protein
MSNALAEIRGAGFNNDFNSGKFYKRNQRHKFPNQT